MKKEILKLLIVGVGSIGSRHFQAAYNTNFKKEIHIVDKKEVLYKLKKKNNFHKKKIFIHTNFKTLPSKIDLAIISTNSDVRFKITNELINKIKIKFIIFEKFLFQQKSHYKFIINKLKEKKIKSWVNCQRRAIPFYSYLKNKIKKNKSETKVYGNKWGLASNSIHYLDLFFYLFGKKRILRIEDNLKDKLYKSKRDGFYDFFGNFSLSFNDNSTMIFEDFNKKKKFVKIKVKLKNQTFDILEKSKTINLKYKNENKYIFRTFKNYYLSEISTSIIKQIILKKKSILPSIEESSNYHLILLKIFLNHQQKIKKKNSKKCLIT